jgi:hypothetical protein
LFSKSFGAGDTCTITASAIAATIKSNADSCAFDTTGLGNLANLVEITGSATSANNSQWHVASVTHDTITVLENNGSTYKLTTDSANASITLKLLQTTLIGVSANSHIVIDSASQIRTTVGAGFGVYLKSESGTPEVDIYILGT